MKNFFRSIPFVAVFGLVFLAACGSSSPSQLPARPTSVNVPVSSGDGSALSFSLKNHGGAMEGHTPRGFKGMGTGLFAGDNLNRNFPDGDGVQLFLTFDLGGIPSGTVASAVLSSEHATAIGTPFGDLGPLRAEEFRYENFSSDLWDEAPLVGGAVCVLAESSNGPFECGVAGAVQRSLDDSYQYVQFRVRLDQAGDRDGEQDLASFFQSNSNTNEPGLFLLDVSVIPN